MTAKQTVLSASLVALLVAFPDFARAEPEADAPPARPSEAAPPPSPPAHHPTGTFEIGAGFASDEGFLASARIAQDDLFGTGDRLSLAARLSAKHQLFDAAFEHRHLFGGAASLTARVTNDLQHLYGFSRASVGGSLTLSRQLAPHLRAFVGYRLEQITVTPDAAPVLARGLAGGALGAQRFRLGTLQTGLVYSTLDAPVLPLRGTSVGTTVEISDPMLGSQVRMLRTTAWAEHHRALGPFTLHLGGTVSAVSSDAPLSERLQLAGASDLRGLPLGGLGPHDGNGMSLGGTFKATARAELEVPLLEKLGISGVGFVDAASLAAGPQAWGSASAGVGLLWRSPIGPLRFDVAFPLDGGRPRFVFGLGGAF